VADITEGQCISLAVRSPFFIWWRTSCDGRGSSSLSPYDVARAHRMPPAWQT
jgi:hypothetical protein